MSEDRTDLMLEILKQMQADMAGLRREQTSQGMRLAAIEEHLRGNLTSLHGIQSDVSDLKMRVDRIERRLGLRDTEH